MIVFSCMDEYSAVFGFLLLDQLWVSVLLTIYWKKEPSLMVTERCTNLGIWEDLGEVVEYDQDISTKFSKIY